MNLPRFTTFYNIYMISDGNIDESKYNELFNVRVAGKLGKEYKHFDIYAEKRLCRRLKQFYSSKNRDKIALLVNIFEQPATFFVWRSAELGHLYFYIVCESDDEYDYVLEQFDKRNEVFNWDC